MDIVYCRLLIQLDMDNKAGWRSRAAIPRYVPGDFREGCPRMDEGNAHVQLQHVQYLFSEGFSCYQYLTLFTSSTLFLVQIVVTYIDQDQQCIHFNALAFGGVNHKRMQL